MGLPPRYFDIVPDVLPKGTLLRSKDKLNYLSSTFAWLVSPMSDGYCTEPGFPVCKERWEREEYPILVSAINEKHAENSRDAVVLWKNQLWAVRLRDFEVVNDD